MGCILPYKEETEIFIMKYWITS